MVLSETTTARRKLTTREAVERRLTDLAETFPDEPTRFDGEIADLRAAIRERRIWLAVWRTMNLEENWVLSLPQPHFDSLLEAISGLQRILSLPQPDLDSLRKAVGDLLSQRDHLQGQRDQRLSKLREAGRRGGRPGKERPTDATLSREVEAFRLSRREANVTQAKACRQVATRHGLSVSTVKRAVRANQKGRSKP